jgi:hypothetical protein
VSGSHSDPLRWLDGSCAIPCGFLVCLSSSSHSFFPESACARLPPVGCCDSEHDWGKHETGGRVVETRDSHEPLRDDGVRLRGGLHPIDVFVHQLRRRRPGFDLKEVVRTRGP